MATIGNSDIYSFEPIPYQVTKKIIEQMQKNICIIKLNNDPSRKMGTGFFCKIQASGKINSMKVLITSNHIINGFLSKAKNKSDKKEEKLEENNNIIISTKENPAKAMELNNRNIYVFEKNNLCLIEIKEEDGIKEFFEVDYENNQDRTQYNNKTIYMLHNQEEEIFLSLGLFKNIDNKEKSSFYHTCSTVNGSSGSPILNLKNNKIIGINMPNNISNNKGIFFDFLKGNSELYHIESIESRPTDDISLKQKVSNLGDNDNKLINGIDLSNKKGFKNFGLPESSKLNSIIQMLTSIKEIEEFITFDDINDIKESKIDKFHHIYVLSSFLRNALIEVYQKGEPKNPSLKGMNIILKFLNENITNASTYEYIYFILNQLHEELISYEDNIPKNGSLISFESPFGEKEKSKNKFYNYYQRDYLKSKISDLFNWIQRTDRTCNHCKKTLYSFKAFPLLLIKLDSMFSYMTKNVNQKDNIRLDLQTCFKIYFSYENKDNTANESCPLCKKNSGFTYIYSLDTPPNYFIIVINKNNYINLFYSEELDITLEKDSKNFIKKYKLIGVVMKDLNSPNNYSYVAKNSVEEKNGKTIENWISFKDENIRKIKFEKGQGNFEQDKEVFDALNAKILIYKDLTEN